MKHFFKTLLVLAVVSIMSTTTTKASHIAAADIYYEYLSPLNYRLHLIIYRKCNPGSAQIFGSATTAFAKDSTCGQNNITIPMDTTGANDPWNGTIRHSLCPNVVPNPCTQAVFPAYEYYHFVADVTLPYVCDTWRFSWDAICCRPTTLANMPTSGNLVYADLNNTSRVNNSTRLTEEPAPYICVNQPYSYLNSPIDPDLDSIVFEATPAYRDNNNPLNGYTPTPVAYTAPYSSLSPIATTPQNPSQYVVNPSTGVAVFTPTAIGQYVLAFTATEYDPITSLKVGAVTRDVVVNVVGCTTTPPSITPPPGSTTVIKNLVGAIDLSTTNNLILGVCPGETMSFDVEATGDTSNNLVKTSSNNTVSCPNSTYISTPLIGGNPVTGTFNWTPDATQIGDHVLVMYFVDSTCTNGQPIILRRTVTVLIKVLRGVSAGPDLPICYLGDSILIPALGPEDITQWTWTELGNNGHPHGMGNPNVQNPFVRPTRTTTYIVNTNGQTACKNNDTITVYIDTTVKVEATATPSILCEPGVTSLNAVPTGPPPTYTCGQENVGCAGASALATFGTTNTALPGVTPFNGSSKGARSQMIFTAAELAAAGWTGPRRIDSLSFNVLNKTSISQFNMEIKMGCTYVSDISAFIPGNLLKKVYENASYVSKAGTNMFKFQNPFIWDGVSNIVVDVCFFNLNTAGVDQVASTSTAPANTYIGATSQFGGCQIPDAPNSSLPTISPRRPNINFYACDLPTTAWQFQWSGPYIFDSTVQSAQAFINENPSTYVVYTRGGNGCLVWDSVNVNLSNHDVLVEPVQETICLNDRVFVAAVSVGAIPGESFQWFADANSSLSDMSCTDCKTPEIVPTTPGAHVYSVIRTDAYGCTDTASITIDVLPLPTINITNGDTIVVRYGEEVQLIAEGGVKYSWSPSWGMNNPNISSPVIKPSESTLYTVYGIDDKGCGSTDEIYVIVDFAHNLFIPTAFSPNGDGNNDLFRIANFGAQRVSEFRVYNRWGQQVFYSRDNTGWDGTYRGEPQDNGTYHYIIKAAFADGHVESFKGDVILVR